MMEVDRVNVHQSRVWLSRLMTHPVKGLDRYVELMETLTEARGAIKVYCKVAPV
jgi:hypothetical protein